ncbi:unnamed protein product, partial [Scytosiphon promiscuus]
GEEDSDHENDRGVSAIPPRPPPDGSVDSEREVNSTTNGGDDEASPLVPQGDDKTLTRRPSSPVTAVAAGASVDALQLPVAPPSPLAPQATTSSPSRKRGRTPSKPSTQESAEAVAQPRPPPPTRSTPGREGAPVEESELDREVTATYARQNGSVSSRTHAEGVGWRSSPRPQLGARNIAASTPAGTKTDASTAVPATQQEAAATASVPETPPPLRAGSRNRKSPPTSGARAGKPSSPPQRSSLESRAATPPADEEQTTTPRRPQQSSSALPPQTGRKTPQAPPEDLEQGCRRKTPLAASAEGADGPGHSPNSIPATSAAVAAAAPAAGTSESRLALLGAPPHAPSRPSFEEDCAPALPEAPTLTSAAAPPQQRLQEGPPPIRRRGRPSRSVPTPTGTDGRHESTAPCGTPPSSASRPCLAGTPAAR